MDDIRFTHALVSVNTHHFRWAIVLVCLVGRRSLYIKSINAIIASFFFCRGQDHCDVLSQSSSHSKVPRKRKLIKLFQMWDDSFLAPQDWSWFTSPVAERIVGNNNVRQQQSTVSREWKKKDGNLFRIVILVIVHQFWCVFFSTFEFHVLSWAAQKKFSPRITKER